MTSYNIESMQVFHPVAGGPLYRLDPHHTADDGRSALHLHTGIAGDYIEMTSTVSLLTNRDLVYEHRGVAGSQPMSTAVHIT